MSSEPSKRILPTHTPLPRPSNATTELGDFLQQRYQTEMAALISEYRHTRASALHKGDLFRLGHRAAGFKLEVSAWLAEATRLLQNSYTDYLKEVQEHGVGEEIKATRDIVVNQAKQHVSAYQKAVDQLKFGRDDLKDITSYCREALRALSEEDYLDRPER